jgi:hypothetical protein
MYCTYDMRIDTHLLAGTGRCHKAAGELPETLAGGSSLAAMMAFNELLSGSIIPEMGCIE